MERPAHPPALALAVERVGVAQRLGVRVEHAAQRLVDRRDALEVGLDQAAGRVPARAQALAQRGERRLVELEWGGAQRPRGEPGAGGGSGAEEPAAREHGA
ncbi:MAG TPA: hypothetical protein VKE22_02765 [Haliangiales bacterium]|nr:hypothetical protein [Haliangiales bacterium]